VSSGQIYTTPLELRPRYRDFSIFQDGGRHHRGFWPSWILIVDFKKFKFLTVGTFKRDKLHHCAKFRQNRSNRGRDFAIFQDGGRRNLGFSKF